MKPLCVIDASSMIYLSKITVMNSHPLKILRNYFDLRISAIVHGEIAKRRELYRLINQAIKPRGLIWSFAELESYEQALFESPYERKVSNGQCPTCRRPFVVSRKFTTNIQDTNDRGERHNCCVALHLSLHSEYGQMIFVCDDQKAKRKFVDPIIENFPIGQFWSSFDVILYLFMRNRKWIQPVQAKNLLRDINVAIMGTSKLGEQAQQRFMRRLTSYNRKVERIDEVLLKVRS